MSEIIIKRLCSDSRQVQPGDLFIALVGMTVDGRIFIQSAIEKGAVAVLSESTPGESTRGESTRKLKMSECPVIEFPDLKNATGPIAARFYGNPSEKMKVIGITGTNGKTSIAHFISEIFTFHKMACGIIGTLGVGFLPQLKSTEYTTPDPIQTQSVLFKLYSEGAQYVAMEVTSHALTQGRVKGCHFDTAIFSNLTRDHLDYYVNMEEYWAAKKRLFTDYKPSHAIVNLESEQGLELMKTVFQAIGYSTKPLPELKEFPLNRLIYARDYHLDERGLYARLETPWGKGDLYSPLLGLFNLSNLLAALGAACVQGLPLATVLKAISQLKPVPGRMNAFGNGKNEPRVIVDFAHTPDALSQLLKALRLHCTGKIWCIFGCGGDRDPGKRSLMGELAAALSDRVIITQDNSRSEDPQKIISDIMKNIEGLNHIQIEMDRRDAIHHAILSADKNDFVIIAGKGHETFQIIGKEKIPFSDSEVVVTALNKRMNERTL